MLLRRLSRVFHMVVSKYVYVIDESTSFSLETGNSFTLIVPTSFEDCIGKRCVVNYDDEIVPPFIQDWVCMKN